MAQEIIERIIAQSKGIIKDATMFRRTVRGADGTGYQFLSDEKINVLYLFYLAEVSDNG